MLVAGSTFIVFCVLLVTGAVALDERDGFGSTKKRGPNRQLFFSSFGESSCRLELQTCQDNGKIGELSLDAWAVFLGDLGEDKESDATLNQLRTIVEQARLVDPTKIFQKLEAGTKEESAKMVEDATDTVESIETVADGGGITEHNKEALLDLINDLQLSIASNFEPPISNLLGLLLLIVSIPVTLPVGIMWSLAIFFTSLNNLSRPFVGAQLMRSSVECEAELLTCQYEAFLLDTIPALLKEVFTNSGVPSPQSSALP